MSMRISDPQVIKFNTSENSGFYPEVRKKVDQYFRENNLTKNADWRLWLKTISLLTADIAIYLAIISNKFQFVGVLVLFILLGITTALICINITHDVLHGSFFKSKKLNRIFGYFFDLNGFSSYVWTKSHNFNHHTYTNIAGLDHDIDKMIWLRLAPSDGYYPFHAYQHIYALFLYTFATLNWTYYSDFKSIYEYVKEGSISLKELLLFTIFRTLYLTLFIAIPILSLSIPWWQTLIGYLAMQMLGGLLAAVVFQLAHVVEGVDYPLPDHSGKMEDIWVEHEMKTTSNFATNDTFVTQLFGALNFQVEHHLFPQIAHVHYQKISPLVRETAKKYDLPYNEHTTFFKTIGSHLKMLKKLGQCNRRDCATGSN